MQWTRSLTNFFWCGFWFLSLLLPDIHIVVLLEENASLGLLFLILPPGSLIRFYYVLLVTIRI